MSKSITEQIQQECKELFHEKLLQSQSNSQKTYSLSLSLSGAHTIGVSHCASFSARLYNFTGKGDTDPSLDPNYVAELKEACKPKDATTLVEMDPGSFRTFDTHFYTLVGKRRVLFNSDSALLADRTTSAYVQAQALPEGSTFLNDFGESMMNMGRIGVLTGSSGEIRKHCAFVN